MAADLTLDTLCDAVRHFLRHIAEHPEQPVDRERGLVLYGVPGDDTMTALMEAFGGEIKIAVREMPKEMGQSALTNFHPLELREPGPELWQPSKEAAQV